jgi:NitT/TauT family transport system substrate-binding protein
MVCLNASRRDRGYCAALLSRPRDRSVRRLHRALPLGLWGPDPVVRREGYDRLHAAMRSAGALSRDIPFDDVVDTTLAESAIRA